MAKGYTKQELKELHQNLVGKKIGRLTVIRAATKEEEKQFNQAKHWLCKCECGNETWVRSAKLLGNAGRGDYQEYSCGCMAVVRSFISKHKILNFVEEDIDWVYKFYKENWEKFSIIHYGITHTSGIKTEDWKSKEEYKKCYEYFWSQEQFNKVYLFWKNTNSKNTTFYDWAKPSLDHIIPKSKGGSTTDYHNWQFITVFENLAKRDMSQEEWEQFQQETNSTSDYYYKSIERNIEYEQSISG